MLAKIASLSESGAALRTLETFVPAMIHQMSFQIGLSQELLATDGTFVHTAINKIYTRNIN